MKMKTKFQCQNENKSKKDRVVVDEFIFNIKFGSLFCFRKKYAFALTNESRIFENFLFLFT